MQKASFLSVEVDDMTAGSFEVEGTAELVYDMDSMKQFFTIEKVLSFPFLKYCLLSVEEIAMK